MNVRHIPADQPRRVPTRIAFVAEAPSDEEMLTGRVLVGPAGRVFNAALRNAGLDRSDYLVTNVFDTQLPDNEVGRWMMPFEEAAKIEGGTAVPPIHGKGFLRMEYRWHLDRLRDELVAADPTVIVPMGGTALWALTGMSSIGAVRGTVMAASRLVPGKKMIPTYHPASLLYEWKFLPVLIGDFLKASREADQGAAIVWPKRELFIEPTLEDLDDYQLDHINGCCDDDHPLSVDIETTYDQVKSIQFAPDVEHALVVPFMDARQFDRNYWRTARDELEAWKWVRALLASPIPKLGQSYGSFDAYRLLVKMGFPTFGFRHDTRLLSHALYPELPKDLEFMGASYGTQGAWKSWGSSGDRGAKRDD